MRAKNLHSIPVALLAFLLSFLSAPAVAEERLQYFDPARWTSEIEAFQQEDLEKSFKEQGIVFVGSSSIRLWNDGLADAMAPLAVIPRGFGGSTMHDLLFYADELVLKYKPRAIVIYEGDNDIGYFGMSPYTVRDLFREFVNTVRAQAPEVRIYVLSIKPSPLRLQNWPSMRAANDLLKDECAADPMIAFIDVAAALFNEAGAIRTDLFLSDGLHLNEAGYDLWRSVIRPVLLESEAAYQ